MHEPTDTSIPPDRARLAENAPAEITDKDSLHNIISMIGAVVRTAVHDAVKEEFEAQQKEAARTGDRRRHNTVLLMKNYNLLKKHCVQAVYNGETMIDEYEVSGAEYYDMMTQLVSKWDAKVKSIELSASRTLLILRHVDRILDTYRTQCMLSGSVADSRKWRVLEAKFLQDPCRNTTDIAKDEFVDRRTIQRDIESALDDLSVLLWGIDGLGVKS